MYKNSLNNKLNGPGKILTYYLYFTLAFFIIAPFEVYYINYLKTILYSIFSWLLFAIGYFKSKNYKTDKKINKIISINTNQLVFLLSIIIIILNLSYILSLGYSLNLTNIINSLRDFGEAYFSKWEIAKDLQFSKNISVQIYTITASINLLNVPIGILNWNKLRSLTKIVLSFSMFMRMILGYLTGTLINIFVVIIEVIICIYALFMLDILPKKKKIIMIYFIFVLLLIFVILGTKAMIDRADYLGWAPWQGLQRWYYNPNNILTPILGNKISFGLNSFLWYFGHGYEGLGQCLELPFVWTYGIGHSRALMEYADQYLGWSWILDRHYLWRNYKVTGRHPLMYWPTALVWIAADVTFIGVFIVLFWIGRFTKRLWLEILERGNPISLALFIRLVILIIFLPMNMQIFQGRIMWWGSIGIILFWLINKKVLLIFR